MVPIPKKYPLASFDWDEQGWPTRSQKLLPPGFENEEPGGSKIG
jgi:hypothetical protein